MYRIKKLALCAGIVGPLLFVMVPPILRTEMDKRDSVAGGVKLLGPAFLKIQRDKGSAILWDRPRFASSLELGRGYEVILDGEREYEWRQKFDSHINPRIDTRRNPLPIPVKVGSLFVFAFRYSSYDFRVANINAKGVNIEVGGDRPSLFFGNQTVFLPWK